MSTTPTDPKALATFAAHEDDLGYGLLLKTIDPAVTDATPAEIQQAAWASVPPVAPVFWSFRIMVALGFYFIALFAALFYKSCVRKQDVARWLLWVTAFSLPLPWIAAELGWTTAEVGRQPWLVYGLMRTPAGLSAVVQANVVLTSLIMFTFIYFLLFAVFIYLLNDKIQHGPLEEDLTPTGKLALPPHNLFQP